MTPVTAQTLDGQATLTRSRPSCRTGRRAQGARRRAGARDGPGGRRPRLALVRRRQAQGLRRHRHRVPPARPARQRHPGRGRGGHRRAQRRSGLHGLPGPAADRARRVRAALAGRPRQGRRRPAPGQPRQAGARRGRPAPVHAGRGDRAAAPPRRPDRRRRGRGRRARPHRRPPARPAAHPALARTPPSPCATPAPATWPRTCATPTSWSPPPASPGSSRPTWSSPAPPSSTSASRRCDGKIAGDVADDVWEVAGWVSPNPKGVGPMTRAMLLSNIVEHRREGTGLTLDPVDDPARAAGRRPRRLRGAPGRRPRRGGRRPTTSRGATPRRSAGRSTSWCWASAWPGSGWSCWGDWRTGIRLDRRPRCSSAPWSGWCCPAGTPACSPSARSCWTR